jgi:mono/diheme cytochrome c family protein
MQFDFRNGRGGMRAFGNELSEAEIKAVVEHVKTLRK